MWRRKAARSELLRELYHTPGVSFPSSPRLATVATSSPTSSLIVTFRRKIRVSERKGQACDEQAPPKAGGAMRVHGEVERTVIEVTAFP
jgi:hypothetical protein